MENMKLLIGVLGGTLVLVLGAAFLFSRGGDQQVAVYDEAVVQGELRNVRVFGGKVVDDQGEGVLEASGEAEASESGVVEEGRVVVTEFSDFQCPACESARSLVERVLEQYGDGVRLVYRHFPIESIHANAMLAAAASEVARGRGVFWEYHDLLFDNQDDWAEESDPRTKFVGYAEELGIGEGFMEELDKGEYVGRVRSDMQDAVRVKINSTPTFFVGGKKVGLGELESELTALQ
jgi:protein-disulfide isomerase